MGFLLQLLTMTTSTTLERPCHKARRRGPLRKIVEVLYYTGSFFDPPRVRLECGHETSSNGVYRAHCTECGKQQ